MEPLTFITIIIGLVLAATCLGLSLRLIPLARRTGSDLRKWKRTKDAQLDQSIARDESLRAQLTRPVGRKRASSIVGLSGNMLRHTDGSYTKAYHVSLSPTIFSEEQVIESRINDLARLLAVRKPVGTVIQFRLSCRPDRGRAISRHLKCRAERPAAALASLLHTMGVSFYEQAAADGQFKEMNLSVWVRVPVKHTRDESHHGLAAFFPALKTEWKKGGSRTSAARFSPAGAPRPVMVLLAVWSRMKRRRAPRPKKPSALSSIRAR